MRALLLLALAAQAWSKKNPEQVAPPLAAKVASPDGVLEVIFPSKPQKSGEPPQTRYDLRGRDFALTAMFMPFPPNAETPPMHWQRNVMSMGAKNQGCKGAPGGASVCLAVQQDASSVNQLKGYYGKGSFAMLSGAYAANAAMPKTVTDFLASVKQR